MGDEIRALLVGGPSEAAIRAAAKRQGMKTLFREALHKAAMGITSLEEVDRVISRCDLDDHDDHDDDDDDDDEVGGVCVPA
jgi:hypothetical protein